MKIVFDNEKEKENFVESLVLLGACPHELGLDSDCWKWIEDCEGCWRDALKEEPKKAEDR